MTETKTIRFLSIIGCLLAGMAASCSSRQVAPNEEGISVQKMTGFPEGEPGFSLGVSACYAGIYQGELLIAGGCNFRKLRQLKEERRNSTKVFMLLTLLQIQFSCGEK